MCSRARVILGEWAEDRAADELTRRGYAILARRYRTRVGEIDIVAQDGETIVFVEVKARSSERYGHPAEAIPPWKQRRIALMAQYYVVCHRLCDRPCRFDVVAILTHDSGAPPAIEVFRDAFQLS
jgi:putative endonuclease